MKGQEKWNEWRKSVFCKHKQNSKQRLENSLIAYYLGQEPSTLKRFLYVCFCGIFCCYVTPFDVSGFQVIRQSSKKRCFSFISALFLKYLAKISFNQKMTQLDWSPWFSNFLKFFDDFLNVFNVQSDFTLPVKLRITTTTTQLQVNKRRQGNRPFYRYGGHIELILRSIIGCPGGMSTFRLYFRALFGAFFLKVF